MDQGPKKWLNWRSGLCKWKRVLWIVQMECLVLVKWSACDCANGCDYKMRMCYVVKRWISYKAPIKTTRWKIFLCDWRVVKRSYCRSSLVPATWNKQERDSRLTLSKLNKVRRNKFPYTANLATAFKQTTKEIQQTPFTNWYIGNCSQHLWIFNHYM